MTVPKNVKPMPVRKRRKHKKSHLGCANCKKRRVKCDEALPQCSQCVKYKVECSYMKMSAQEMEDRRRTKQMVAQIEAGGVLSPPLSTSPQSTHRSSTTSVSSLLSLNTPLEDSKPFIVKQGFETEVLRGLYSEWMNWLFGLASENTILYDAMMAFSFGFMAIKTGEEHHRMCSDIHRARALASLQTEITRVNIENTDSVLATSLILSWDVFLQQEDFEACVTLSKGVAAVLEKVEITNSQTGMAICMRDAILQSIKSIKMPPYNAAFLSEFLQNARDVSSYVAASNDHNLIREHTELVNFVAEVEVFLQTNSRQQDSAGTTYFAPILLFRMLRKWLRLFPCAALSRTRRQQPHHTLVYLYYHAVTRVLDALFPEVRYIFQFGFIGPIDMVGFENIVNDPVYADLISEPNSNYNAMIRYPLKVLTFFKERLFKLNQLLVASSPLDRDNYEQVVETYIRSFNSTLISQEHFPTIMHTRFDDKFDEAFSPIITPPSDGDMPFPEQADFFQAYFSDRMEILQSVSIY